MGQYIRNGPLLKGLLKDKRNTWNCQDNLSYQKQLVILNPLCSEVLPVWIFCCTLKFVNPIGFSIYVLGPLQNHYTKIINLSYNLYPSCADWGTPNWVKKKCQSTLVLFNKMCHFITLLLHNIFSQIRNTLSKIYIKNLPDRAWNLWQQPTQLERSVTLPLFSLASHEESLQSPFSCMVLCANIPAVCHKQYPTKFLKST